MADQTLPDLRGFIPPHPTPEQARAVGNAFRTGQYIPTLIGVFCDRCDTTVEADYLVHVDDDQPARFEVARVHLRTLGWRCDQGGDRCPEHTHSPCCSSHGAPMNCARYRRTHFVEVGACCSAWTPTVDDVRKHPAYYLAGAGLPLAERTNCPHGYRLTDSCPGCATDEEATRG